ncbi:hypothetical protein WICPIJ_003524 [Wickerhamomyces pijperi]|uniref:Uncharacterized protein n=1 Tax=Wickerhamomyces pijperi TaxID=599730 RepID=A0A9P8Q7N4_WICPI|nr:hypothetical protein WICPIJ_003524 [Wickerhamomyces pijperi]
MNDDTSMVQASRQRIVVLDRLNSDDGGSSGLTGRRITQHWVGDRPIQRQSVWVDPEITFVSRLGDGGERTQTTVILEQELTNHSLRQSRDDVWRSQRGVCQQGEPTVDRSITSARHHWQLRQLWRVVARLRSQSTSHRRILGTNCGGRSTRDRRSTE